jgi:hypothetical protein
MTEENEVLIYATAQMNLENIIKLGPGGSHLKS